MLNNVIHQENIQAVHGRVMYHIFSFGDVGTLAAYAILRKNCEYSRINAYKASNGKVVSGYNLLRKKTSLSLSVLQSKVPSLIKAGLCYFETDGSFVMMGGRTIEREYYEKPSIAPIYNTKQKKAFEWKPCKHIKLVAIDTSSYIKSKDFIRLLLLHSAQMLQNKEADRKKARNELLLAYSQDKVWEGMSARQYKSLLALKRSHPKKFANNRSESCLSLKGTANVVTLGMSNSKTKGQYYRTKYKRMGMLFTDRAWQVVKGWENKKLNEKDIDLIARQYKDLIGREDVGLRIIGGVLHREVASSFIVNTVLG